MPRDTECDHPNCFGEPCRALTKEELTPDEDDLAFAREFLAAGWAQTSRRYRMFARVLHPIPPGDWHISSLSSCGRRSGNLSETKIPGVLIEHCTLTVKQEQALRKIGGVRLFHHMTDSLIREAKQRLTQ